MRNYEKIFAYIGTAAIVLLLIGLGGWYFFLRGQSIDIEAAAQARGFDISIPSFLGSRGSTAANIETGLIDPSTSGETDTRPPRLWRVSTSPVAGSGFITSGTTSMLRFVERSTGHVVDADPVNGKITRKTNALTPKVYDAKIGMGPIARQTLDGSTLVTSVGVLGTTTEQGFYKLSSTNLGADVRDIAVSPYSSDILFLATSGAETHLIRAGSTATSPRQLASFGIGSFHIQWLRDNRIILGERAGSGVPGNAYVFDGALTPLVRGVPGLLVLPYASSSALIYSSDTGESLNLFLRAGGDTSVINLGLPTVAEKCVWLRAAEVLCAVPNEQPGSDFLNRWYRGSVHTTDTWYRISIATGESEKFYSPDESLAIDVERPMIDDRGEYLSFMNARDKSLWVLRIEK